MARAEFHTLLSSLAPSTVQVPEVKEKMPVEPAPLPEPETIGETVEASIQLPEPEMQLPPYMRIAPVGGEISEVKSPEDGVKNSTGLDISKTSPEPLEIGAKGGHIEKIVRYVTTAAQEQGVDPALGMAVIAAESSFNPKAISADGHFSKGLFQLLDSTGRELHEQSGARGKYNPFDPALNISLGISYLRRLHDLFSSETELPNQAKTTAAANSTSLEKLAVAAFNAGEGRVASAQERAQRAGKNPAEYGAIAPYLPETTREYVERVRGYKTQFEKRFIG